MSDGLRHRRAANRLGEDPAMTNPGNSLLSARDVARTVVESNPDRWMITLGRFVYLRTARDLGVTLSPSD